MSIIFADFANYSKPLEFSEIFLYLFFFTWAGVVGFIKGLTFPTNGGRAVVNC